MRQKWILRSYSTWAFCMGFIAVLSVLLLQPLSPLQFFQAAAGFSFPSGHSVFAAAFAVPAFWIASGICASGLLGFCLASRTAFARKHRAAATSDPYDRPESGEENWMFI